MVIVTSLIDVISGVRILSYRLVNQNNPEKTLGINRQTWYGILDLAEEHGWNPMGTVQPEWQAEAGDFYDPWAYERQPGLNGSYTEDPVSLVLFEDALNFADALENAFSVYEPEWTWLYCFEDNPFTLPARQFKPSIGAISLVMDFCREGTFYIERR